MSQPRPSGEWLLLAPKPHRIASRALATPIRRATVGDAVIDVRETPAVPPFDPQGDVRLGYFIAGGILLFLGWGLGVVVNVVLHLFAPASFFGLLGVHVGRTLGPYAWAVLGLGLFTGAFGIVLLALGRESPRGPIVRPGAEI
jgi:hypothetical protein